MLDMLFLPFGEQIQGSRFGVGYLLPYSVAALQFEGRVFGASRVT
jgi:hypothetical protein